jgi:hypothetical protein
MHPTLRLLFLYSLLALALITPAQGNDLMPFALGWDDHTDSITNRKSLLPAPAGQDGFVQIKDGHLVNPKGERVRLLGVNLSFNANFPYRGAAEKVAQRMAKFGINCVRFHHTDTDRAPRGIWKAGVPDKQTIDPIQLDKMDYFIHQLKLNGIYVDINLKIGREVTTADGVQDPDQLPTYDKGPDHYYPRLVELQKNYARDLLTHTNPYTGNPYTDEPAVALIEINNESGLVNAWHGSNLDTLPLHFLTPLQQDWNAFLQTRYTHTENLQTAWAPSITGTEQEMLTQGLNAWVLEQHEDAKANLRTVREGPNGELCKKIDITAPGSQSWHVQAKYTPLQVTQEQYIRTTLDMRSDTIRQVNIVLQQDHSPWGQLDQSISVTVGPEWKTYAIKFQPSASDTRARLAISGLGSQTGTLWFANPSMIDTSPIGLRDNETLDDQSVPLFTRTTINDRSTNAKRDWFAFLIHRESAYYIEMNDYLKNTLGCKSPIVGSQLHFGTALSQMENDVIDHHGYWRHPNFPNRPWDSVDWIVQNDSMVQEPQNTLQGIMINRIDGMPFVVTEYNHPAPNTFSSECAPLLAAYAAFQDWDGIFLYSYSHTNEFSTRSINSFFDIAGHTPKMLTLPTAANMFLRQDIAPGSQSFTPTMSAQQYIDFIYRQNGSTWASPLRDMNVPWQTPYLHKTSLRIADIPADTIQPVIPGASEPLISDTQQLRWLFDGDASHVVFNAPRTKGFVGFIPSAPIQLSHGIDLTIHPTIQNWANVLLTWMKDDQEGQHWLLTATGYHENEGMVWKNDAKTSVGNQWGSGAPLVEPVSLTITMPSTSENIRLYALNESGQRSGDLTGSAVAYQNDRVELRLTKPLPSLWYEVVIGQTAVKNSLSY